MLRSSLSRLHGHLTPFLSTTDLPLAPNIPTANQMFWYSADRAYTDAGMTVLCSVDGVDTCYTLKDQSAAGNHLVQATGGSRPLWIASAVNSLPALRFASSDMEVTFAHSQPNSIYIVFRYISNSGNDFGVFDGLAINTMELSNKTSSTTNMYAGAEGTEVTTNTGTYYCISTVYNGASSIIKRNADAEISTSVGTATPTGFTLGAAGPGSFHTNIEVAEVIGYTVAHNTTTRNIISAYLITKYAL